MKKTILSLLGLCITICSFSQAIGNVPQKGVEEEVNNDTTVYTVVDIEASYRGGSAAWNKFLASNLNANVGVENSARTGTYNVVILFRVMKDGTLKDFKAKTKYGHGFEEEVIRVLKLSSPWIPAVKNGRAVISDTKYKQVFKISSE